jgi:hypothetical protein
LESVVAGFNLVVLFFKIEVEDREQFVKSFIPYNVDPKSKSGKICDFIIPNLQVFEIYNMNVYFIFQTVRRNQLLYLDNLKITAYKL